MGSCLCDKCAALCCRYFALPIDTPETAKEYDDVRWYLVHENVAVFIEKGTWYVAVMNKCRHLQPDNRCGIYETRPRICRSYSTENCDYHGGEYDYDKLFTSAEQLREYAAEQLAKEREKKRRKKLRQATTASAPARRKSATRRPPRLRVAALAANGMPPKTNGAVHSNGKAGLNGNGKSVSLPLLTR